MTVKFFVNDVPSFYFDSRFVPAGHLCSYYEETDIFNYLNSRLTPTDIKSVRIDSDGINAYVVIIYELDELTECGLPPFHSIPDEIPF